MPIKISKLAGSFRAPRALSFSFSQRPYDTKWPPQRRQEEKVPSNRIESIGVCFSFEWIGTGKLNPILPRN